LYINYFIIKYLALLYLLQVFLFSIIKVVYGVYYVYNNNNKYYFKEQWIIYLIVSFRVLFIFIIEVTGLIVYDLNILDIITYLYEIISTKLKKK